MAPLHFQSCAPVLSKISDHYGLSKMSLGQGENNEGMTITWVVFIEYEVFPFDVLQGVSMALLCVRVRCTCSRA